MNICGDFNLPLSGRCAKTGFQRVFKQIGQYQTHIDLVDWKHLRQIELGAEGKVLALCKGAVIADDAVRRAVFAEAHIQIRDPRDGFCKIVF